MINRYNSQFFFMLLQTTLDFFSELIVIVLAVAVFKRKPPLIFQFIYKNPQNFLYGGLGKKSHKLKNLWLFVEKKYKYNRI